MDPVEDGIKSLTSLCLVSRAMYSIALVTRARYVQHITISYSVDLDFASKRFGPGGSWPANPETT